MLGNYGGSSGGTGFENIAKNQNTIQQWRVNSEAKSIEQKEQLKGKN